MRLVSLNARTAFDASTTDEVEIALIMITHPTLSAPIRLSTDPTERISTAPLIYGTRSTWMGSDPATEPFLFVLAAANVPGDQEDAPAATTLVLDNLNTETTELLRSFIDRPVVHMAVVLKSSPDLVEVEFRNMLLTSVDASVGELSLNISRQPIEDESVPMDRFTKDRFPGLYQ